MTPSARTARFIYLHALIRARGSSAPLPPPPASEKSTAGPITLLAGLGLLAIGAHLSLTAAIDTSTSLGISERIIGLFVLGAGSSLPELVTSCVAVRRGSGDLAIGNVLGSCLFNLLFVVGLATSVAPTSVAVSSAVQLDLAIMAGAFAMTALFLRSGLRLSRVEGAVLIYLIYAVVALSFGPTAAA